MRFAAQLGVVFQVAERRQEAHGGGKPHPPRPAVRARRPRAAQRGPTKCSRGWGSPIGDATWSKRSPAGCGGASSWPRACCTGRGCCCSTSRRPASTPARGATCGSISSRSASEDGVTVVLTTHLLEEAERADRIAIMHQGELVALDTPAALAGRRRRRRDHDSHRATRQRWPPTSSEQFQRAGRWWSTARCGSSSRTATNGSPRLVEAFPDRIDSITLGKPTLEDVFIHVTGHRFWNDEPSR